MFVLSKIGDVAMKQIGLLKTDVAKAARGIEEVTLHLEHPTGDMMIVIARELSTLSKDLAWAAVEAEQIAKRLMDIQMIHADMLRSEDAGWVYDDDQFGLNQDMPATDENQFFVDSSLC